MKGFVTNIEQATVDNSDFRRVLYTGKHAQLVLMSLKPSEEIGMEVHANNDQFFRVEAGAGRVVIDETEYQVKAGDAIIVPAGARHNVINVSAETTLQLYTLYSPPHHKDGIVRETKTEANDKPEEFDGTTTE